MSTKAKPISALLAKGIEQTELEKYISDGFEIYGHYREPMVPIDQVRIFPPSAAGKLDVVFGGDYQTKGSKNV